MFPALPSKTQQTIPTTVAWVRLLDETSKPHSRNCYPGSTRSTPRWRQRAYPARETEHDEARAVLGASARLCDCIRLESSLLPDARNSIFSALSEHNLPRCPSIQETDQFYGILIVGKDRSGKTSLTRSLLAAASGSYPSRFDRGLEEKKNTMPVYGQSYEMPAPSSVVAGGDVRRLKLVLTDTPPLRTAPAEDSGRDGPQLSAAVFHNARFAHHAVVMVIDATSAPLWEDPGDCRRVARLLELLRQGRYTVVLAVTGLGRAREEALRDLRRGLQHGGRVGRDPRGGYEAYAAQYIGRVCTALEGAAGAAGGDPPVPNATIFDAPAWGSVGEWRAAQAEGGTRMPPNRTYAQSQLARVLVAAQRAHNPPVELTPPHYVELPSSVPLFRLPA